MNFEDPVKNEVWQTALKLNDCWSEGHPEDLPNYFHRDIIAITPALRERTEGGQACVDSQTAFARAAKIAYFGELEPWIEVRGDMAVAAYHYEMECVMEGRDVHLSGRDLMVLVREAGRWMLIADHFSPDPRADA